MHLRAVKKLKLSHKLILSGREPVYSDGLSDLLSFYLLPFVPHQRIVYTTPKMIPNQVASLILERMLMFSHRISTDCWCKPSRMEWGRKLEWEETSTKWVWDVIKARPFMVFPPLLSPMHPAPLYTSHAGLPSAPRTWWALPCTPCTYDCHPSFCGKASSFPLNFSPDIAYLEAWSDHPIEISLLLLFSTVATYFFPYNP